MHHQTINPTLLLKSGFCLIWLLGFVPWKWDRNWKCYAMKGYECKAKMKVAHFWYFANTLLFVPCFLLIVFKSIHSFIKKNLIMWVATCCLSKYDFVSWLPEGHSDWLMQWDPFYFSTLCYMTPGKSADTVINHSQSFLRPNSGKDYSAKPLHQS